MINLLLRRLLAALCLLTLSVQNAPAAEPAVPVLHPEQAPLMAIAQAGRRLVAVGDHGVVVLSDDQGKSFRQAHLVPTRALLTSVSFADDLHGWAAGHDGTILATSDAGENWAVQHEDLQGDKAIFAIHFSDLHHGLAVGLFGLSLSTEDGGAHWTSFVLEAADEATDQRPMPGAAQSVNGADDAATPDAGDDSDSAAHSSAGTGGSLAADVADDDVANDLHLYAIFGAGEDLWVAAEHGTLFHTIDGGAHWQRRAGLTSASLWAGCVISHERVLAVGQRGHMIISEDHGEHWHEVGLGINQSLTSIVQQADGRIWLAGLAGTLAYSDDGGRDFVVQARADRQALTAGIARPSMLPLWLGPHGVLAP